MPTAASCCWKIAALVARRELPTVVNQRKSAGLPPQLQNAELPRVGFAGPPVQCALRSATAFFCDRSFPGVDDPRPFRAPALPLAEVVDPTGAGDSFAGGFYGYIASQPKLTPSVFRRAMFYGGVMGSFAVERFGTERLQGITQEEINERFSLFREISHLGDEEL